MAGPPTCAGLYVRECMAEGMLVLGLSGGYGHDTSACLVRDGAIVAMAEEERFCRVRHAMNWEPLQATAYCLDEAGVTLSDVDCVAISWEPVPEDSPWPTRLHDRMLRREPFRGHDVPPTEVIEHHLAHAASAYFTSGLERASILVIDGQGDSISTTMAMGAGSRIEVLRSFGNIASIGFFYLALTDYLGFGFGEEGKTMGLAAYGKQLAGPGPFQLTGDGYQGPNKRPRVESRYGEHKVLIQDWMRWLEDRFGRPRASKRHFFDRGAVRLSSALDLTEFSADVAATGQFWLESVVSHLVEKLVQETGCRDLVMSGGVALNCSLNGRLRQSGLVDDLFIFPAAGDAGASAGAALAAYYGSTTSARAWPPRSKAGWCGSMSPIRLHGRQRSTRSRPPRARPTSSSSTPA